MDGFVRRGTLLFIAALLVSSLSACGGSDADEADTGGSSQGAATTEPVSDPETPAETEVVGMPAGFPADVPVHPGTVTEYDPIAVTDTSTVHQLYVESQSSFDDVVAWYQTSLPSGWSVGYFESEDNQGMEAKIALDGGDYTPVDPEGVGGGVLVGVFENDDATLIVTTVTVMEAP
ncbi:MAG: hypothetical protein P1P71_09960 [Anaerosomatales bacterium]|nr:hypothetical protein [Anaerosomatales bacterium]